MLAWVKRVFGAIFSTPDVIAMSIGMIGFCLLSIGVALVSVPAAFIVSGLILMAWSALFARSIARSAG